MMKHHKVARLPFEIEVEIKMMARADFRSYDQELARLQERGLEIPRNWTVADEACIIAALAYLRDQQIDESTEG